MMFSHWQDNKIEGRKDVEVLDKFPFFRGHTTIVEGEPLERSGRRIVCLFVNIAATLLAPPSC